MPPVEGEEVIEKVEGSTESTEMSESSENVNVNEDVETTSENKSDDDWKTVFDQLKKDNESLKGELTKRDAKHQELEETIEGLKRPTAAPGSATPNIDHWKASIVTEATRQFAEQVPITVKEDGTVQVNERALRQQFSTVIQTTDQMVGAILRDKVAPFMSTMYDRMVKLTVENEILHLRQERDGSDDSPKFTDFEPEVRKALSKLPTDQKDKEGIVRETFLRVAGSSLLNKPKPSAPVKQPIKEQLRDLSAGSGVNAGGGAKQKARLTESQEKDRQSMSNSFGYEVDPGNYLSQLEARRKRAKAEGKRIPETLREWE